MEKLTKQNIELLYANLLTVINLVQTIKLYNAPSSNEYIKASLEKLYNDELKQYSHIVASLDLVQDKVEQFKETLHILKLTNKYAEYNIDIVYDRVLIDIHKYINPNMFNISYREAWSIILTKYVYKKMDAEKVLLYLLYNYIITAGEADFFRKRFIKIYEAKLLKSNRDDVYYYYYNKFVVLEDLDYVYNLLK